MKKAKLFMTAILVALTLSGSLVSDAAAANTVDPAADVGSITVTLKKSGNGIAGLQVSLYQVGTGRVEDSQLLFEPVPELLGAEVGLNGLTAAQNMECASKLLEYIRVQEDSSPKVLRAATDSNGTVVFQNLPVGVYLVQSAANDSYQSITSYLLYLPADNGKGTSWDFDIQGQPKVEAQPGGGGTTPEEPIPETPPTTVPGEEPPVPEEVAPEEIVPELPQTGLLRWPIPLMTAAGALLVMAGVQKKRKDHGA